VSGSGEHDGRLVLLGERFRSAAALLVERSLGLRNPADLRARAPSPARKPWLRAEYDDEQGGRWLELDVAELVRDAEFLSVAI
jgi:twitching motility protein PilI